MGCLVLKSENNKEFVIIDGQQRMTTLALLVLAGIKVLGKLVEEGNNTDDNDKRMQRLRRGYIGELDPVSLMSEPKLTLNRNGNHYFQKIISPLQESSSRTHQGREQSA